MSKPISEPDSARPSTLRRVLAWGVHFYTALGLVAAAAIAVLIVDGSNSAFRWCFVLMVLATLVDATDGVLARAVRIKETLPNFDGRRLDDLVDFLNYTFLPLFLIWRAKVLPEGQEYWLLLPLLASAYGFCQVSIKTEDGYFLGFPSFWNLVAFYIWVLQPLPSWVTMTLLIVPALLTFVPTRYLYPSVGKGKLNQLTNLLGGIWAGLVIWLLFEMPGGDSSDTSQESWPRSLAVLSLFFPIYYLAASWGVTWRFWKVRRRARKDRLRAALIK
jgi:phosphatidylcholine synthase